ncbi:MAG TPA: hypothetical protein ENJ82_10030, partial [Bacteroidetes bacterium]|nr:hypothetical protein [Bacteroidota bacterium]
MVSLAGQARHRKACKKSFFTSPPNWGRSFIRFFFQQLALPIRQHFHAKNTLWAETARLFSWDMFHTFKSSKATFYGLVPALSQGLIAIKMEQNGMPQGQRNKISQNPDQILQFAHYIG